VVRMNEVLVVRRAREIYSKHTVQYSTE